MILSIIASTLLVLSVLIKERKRALLAQSASCLFSSLYDFTVSAYTSSALNLVNFIRTFLFVQKEKLNKSAYFAILLLFEGVVLTNCYFTWAGAISLLPTCASVVRTYCLWQSNMRLIRISGIISGFLFSMYYIYYKSWFMLLGYGFLFIAGIYAVIVNDIMKGAKENA